MSAAQLQTIRDETLNAIEAITTGKAQSYTVNGRSFTKLNISELWAQLREVDEQLQTEARKTSNRMTTGVASFKRVSTA